MKCIQETLGLVDDLLFGEAQTLLQVTAGILHCFLRQPSFGA
jgi:hypothetical protein